jgi:hypothetical protein
MKKEEARDLRRMALASASEDCKRGLIPIAPHGVQGGPVLALQLQGLPQVHGLNSGVQFAGLLGFAAQYGAVFAHRYVGIVVDVCV